MIKGYIEKHIISEEYKSEVFLMDCVEGMKMYEDDYFDLAIVDPPYGIGHSLLSGESRGSKFIRNERHVDWDILPKKEYFDELFRVSKNQIIWGGNYFIEHLTNTKGMVIWDKMQEFSGSDFEFAWTSFNNPSKAYRKSRVEAYSKMNKIHPTQKPIGLYQFCLNYASVTKGDKILDTHLGSGSSRIAAKTYDLNFTGFEVDIDYYNKSNKYYEDFVSQLTLF